MELPEVRSWPTSPDAEQVICPTEFPDGRDRQASLRVFSAARTLDDVLTRVLGEVSALGGEARLSARYDKFRNMGRLGIDFVDQA